MGLASHLEAVMNGTFLIAIGTAWSHVKLTATWDKLTFWLISYGTYANWLFTGLAAIFGTSETTPIAGHGFSGLVWQEQLVTMGLISVGATLVLGCSFIVYGLLRNK
jgi:hydroxylaminobenzene mutase